MQAYLLFSKKTQVSTPQGSKDIEITLKSESHAKSGLSHLSAGKLGVAGVVAFDAV